VAAIALNRWGHAYVVPEPGFHFGRNGAPPAADVVRASVGPVAFASAELRGVQSFRGAVYEARRAFAQVLPYLSS
jgi:spermidine dehydrogenase